MSIDAWFVEMVYLSVPKRGAGFLRAIPAFLSRTPKLHHEPGREFWLHPLIDN
jgi:hypothetical protein